MSRSRDVGAVRGGLSESRVGSTVMKEELSDDDISKIQSTIGDILKSKLKMKLDESDFKTVALPGRDVGLRMSMDLKSSRSLTAGLFSQQTKEENLHIDIYQARDDVDVYVVWFSHNWEFLDGGRNGHQFARIVFVLSTGEIRVDSREGIKV